MEIKIMMQQKKNKQMENANYYKIILNWTEMISDRSYRTMHPKIPL